MGVGSKTDPAVLAAAVAQMRRSVAAGGAVDLTTLTALAAVVPDHSRATGAGADMALLGLLDEVDLLIGEFGRQQAAASNQLRALSRHHQAGSAYGGWHSAP